MRKIVYLISGFLLLLPANYAFANVLIFSGKTYKAINEILTFETPYRESFNTTALYRLDYLKISDGDAIAYDFSSNSFTIYPLITPYALLTSHVDFKSYLVDCDVAVLDQNTLLFNGSSNITEINAALALVYVGTDRSAQTDTDADGIGNVYDLDDDNDVLPDFWEERYGLAPLENDAASDPDHDGYSNLAEYLSGSNPTDANSTPQVDFMVWLPLVSRDK